MGPFERIGQAWVEWHRTRPEVPHERPTACPQHATDLGETCDRIGQWCIDNVLTTTSNDPSGNGSVAASPTTNAGRRSSPGDP